MAIVRFQRLDEPLPGGFILALRGEDDPLGQQVGKHADILMALTHAEFIDPHATHITKIGLGVGHLHVLEDHPPQPRVAFAHQLAHLAYRHLSRQQQCKGFKLPAEMSA